ncbi:glutathione S-transferase family protein [Candidatus Thiodiazotropha sp. CDECU1]|uniref:glutathione S-transferase family protein n=1 Tax=Candidatus Thiodiazotropha sp. CDECU1 TaxID=3065865 RepID=UPI002931B14B|nr:glutathione S-transferase family protein [Candidatus Thiodiazotropha sp. CDECU1]
MTNLTLVIGNKNYSSWSLRPWIFLRHNKLKFEEKRISLFVETTEQELAEYDSDHKVPVLQDSDLIVWDSLSILEYVSEVYLNGKGWPYDRMARAVARSVSAEMHSSFMHVRNELPMNCRKQITSISLSHEAEREIDRIKSLWERCRREFGFTGKWLFGDYSIADAMFAPIALRFSGYNIQLIGVAKEYVDTVMQQPEINEWIEAGKLETEIIEDCEL